MSKMKKLFAMIMTIAMVMGMCMTTMAATTPGENVTATKGKITIKNLTKEETTVDIYKIVNWNETSGTWESVKEEYNTYIKYEEDPVIINWDGLKAYIEEKKIAKSGTTQTTDGKAEFDNLGIGAYLVIASGVTTSYNVMGSFTYGYDSNHLMVPTDVTIQAKGSKYQVSKKLADKSMAFVGLGDEVKYNITTVFPSYPETDQQRTFWIQDTPTGLEITDIKVYVGNMTTPLIKGTDYTLDKDIPSSEAVKINFASDYIGMSNEHAAEAVKVEVTAKVVRIDAHGQFKNKAETSHGSEPSEAVGDTGSMTIRKVDSNDNLLNGAIFNVKLNDQMLEFVKEDDGVYRLALDTDSQKTSDLVATNGTLTLKGLDEGTYSIIEKQAPAGYQVVDVNTLVKAEDRTIKAGDHKDITFNVVNTKLASLPGTGGIGTTIFTIGGCVIMIAAAAMYFANRKKEEQQ